MALLLRIAHTEHYDLGAKGLPLTITDGDVEGNPPLAITGNTHVS